jgi:hypothetical protein
MRIRLVLLAALCWFGIVSVDVQAEQPQVRDLGILIEKIKQETDSRRRYDLATELAHGVSQLRASEQIDDKFIDDLAGLLGDRVVRFWIAGSLGQLGPRAMRAVPALESALKEEEVAERAMSGVPSVSIGDAIRLALKKIGASPPE